MKPVYIAATAIAAAVVIGAGTYMIDIHQTEEAALPEVTIEGGNMPEYDADVGSISVEETTVTVPTLEVTPPEDTAELSPDTDAPSTPSSTN